MRTKIAMDTDVQEYIFGLGAQGYDPRRVYIILKIRYVTQALYADHSGTCWSLLCLAVSVVCVCATGRPDRNRVKPG